MISVQKVFKIGKKKRIAARNNDTERLKGNDMPSYLVFTITNQTHANLPTEKHEILHRRGKTTKRKLAEIA